MNILPKKRWHVRTKENIARVRKDQAKAREEEDERIRKEKFADREARIEKLRSRVSINTKETEPSTSSQLIENELNTESKHVNLFADFEEGITQSKTKNEEHRKEKLEEQQDYEKKIGLLTFLGQDTNEALKLKSWYELHPDKRPRTSTNEEKDANIKFRYDPLNIIKAVCSGKKPDLKHKIAVVEHQDKKEHIDNSPKAKKRKKEKHKKKDKRDKKSLEKELQKEKEDRLRKLREERLRREAIEKNREKMVINKSLGIPIAKESSVPPTKVQPVKQKYNSQFNPHIAKQNFM